MTAQPDPSAAGSQPSMFSAQTSNLLKGTGWVTAYTDGGSRGNPGPSGYGVVIQAEGGTVLAELSEFIGMRTNNVAEYSGLLAALEFALAKGHSRLRVVSDSELMVKQMRGQYRVQSPELRPLYEEAKRRAAKLEAFQIEHVLRGKNKKADELANLAMDRGMRRKTETKSPAALAAGSANTPMSAPPIRPLRGIVKEGKISLLEGSIPDGTIVVVMPEKALGQRLGETGAAGSPSQYGKKNISG
jgi:ribonuclease HI